MDRGVVVSQRGPRAGAGVDLKEIEANQIAAELLMPLVTEAVTASGGTRWSTRR